MKTRSLLLTLLIPLLALLAGGTARAVDGTFTATESWTVRLEYSYYGDPPFTGTVITQGTEHGTLVIRNGAYTLLNHTGVNFSSPGQDLMSRHTSEGGLYYSSGSYVFGPAPPYGLAFLGGFAVKVPLRDGEIPVFTGFNTYSGSGFSLESITGGGYMSGPDLVATVSSTLSLVEVVGPPTIVGQPTNQTRYPGQDAAFSVLAGGHAPLSYSWRKGTTPLPGQNGSSLVLTNIQAADAGSYSVIVSNSGGSVTSIGAVLTLKAVPPPWIETWESATPGTYALTTNFLPCVFGDKGCWLLGDTVSVAGDCGPALNTAEILLENGSKFLKLNSVANDLGCAENVSAEISSRGGRSFPIPVTRNTEISFREQGWMENPVWNGFFGCIVRPCGDTVALKLTDDRNNQVLYIFQRAANYVEHSETNGPSQYGYREIFLDASGGTFSRNLYDDFAPIAGSAGIGDILGIEFGIASHGWASLDDLKIGANSGFIDAIKPLIAVLSPAQGKVFIDPVATLSGTASDNIQLASLKWRVNSKEWLPVSSTNGWKNWIQDVPLEVGTNLIQSYATDLAGNNSPTNTVSVFYSLRAPIQVNVKGLGTTSITNGQRLEIGRAYTITATAKPGYAFTNWSGDVVTNKPTALFLMESNLALTACFVDVQRPTCTLTTPLANQRWSNEVFTLHVKAGDNDAVSNVWYRLNSNDWSPANPVGDRTNWTTQIDLTPGTNMVRVFAEDGAGNKSPTNAVAFFYVVPAPLVVQLHGRGKANPNYDGQLLEIGRNYTMTAAPGPGFAFTNWSGSRETNKPALTFMMDSNLTLVANFVDVQKPTVAVLSPISNQRWSNEVFTLRVKAGDNDAVSKVWHRLNLNDWSLAEAVGDNTNWTANLALTPGTNIVRVFAEDAAGNLSATNSVYFFYVVPAPLVVQMHGRGKATPNYDGQLLEIGRNYSMTASPGPGFVFTNWTGSRETNKPGLTFMMGSNLTLVANFVDVQKPTVTVISPAANQRWSNEVFMLHVKAADNDAVADITYRLNLDDWSSANPAGDGTNWISTLTLTPGTNILRVFARDVTGNLSATNTVSFVYVLPTPIVVQTNGSGKATPNLNGQSLEIGRNYTMTASASPGWAFTNWSGSRETNKATLTFLMDSNLTLIANFVDLQKPILTVTTPPSPRPTNSTVLIRGTARDNDAIAGVWYGLNTEAPVPAETTNAWTNWSALLTIPAGTNTLRIYATDRGLNYSSTNSFVLTLAASALKSASQPQVVVKALHSHAGIDISFNAGPGEAYVLEVSANLADWEPGQKGMVPEDGKVSISKAAASGSARFFRIRFLSPQAQK